LSHSPKLCPAFKYVQKQEEIERFISLSFGKNLEPHSFVPRLFHNFNMTNCK